MIALFYITFVPPLHHAFPPLLGPILVGECYPESSILLAPPGVLSARSARCSAASARAVASSVFARASAIATSAARSARRAAAGALATAASFSRLLLRPAMLALQTGRLQARSRNIARAVRIVQLGRQHTKAVVDFAGCLQIKAASSAGPASRTRRPPSGESVVRRDYARH